MAVDGVNDVDKIILEQYDLVLIDIVVSNLDGVAAILSIREFDPRIPGISMTSNLASQALMSYMSSGRNDILPKPFIKECLHNVLAKDPIHMKTVKRWTKFSSDWALLP